MDDQGCPRCKTTKYRNPSLKLMVNVCGHTLCESCVDLLFVRGAGNCHECDTPLRKSNFRVQLFEDPAVDKEVEIRKKVLKIYNKREDDFPSLTEYNDFLEEIEEIVFNLTNNVDLENTKRKMELYQKDNKEVIQKNKIKLSPQVPFCLTALQPLCAQPGALQGVVVTKVQHPAFGLIELHPIGISPFFQSIQIPLQSPPAFQQTREQEELEEALEVERQENEQRRLLIQKEEQLQQMIKRKNKQALLDDLESSNLPASLLLAQHKDRPTQLEMQLEKPKPVKPVTFSTGIKMGQHISLAPIQKLEEALYEYQPLQVETYGPQVPELEMLGRLGYLNHVRAASPQDLAGGYTSSLACHRALQDAFSGLFWHPS
ncbi:CDK-activating kinase assembly factor MAT1 isoform X2 [Columba livia]|uniref:CDK-activating kinase assembly factor MAT1 isoform X2 n=1 Tax=Columba livia TaxID=8932 RepID=UPI0031BB63F2